MQHGQETSFAVAADRGMSPNDERKGHAGFRQMIWARAWVKVSCAVGDVSCSSQAYRGSICHRRATSNSGTCISPDVMLLETATAGSLPASALFPLQAPSLIIKWSPIPIQGMFAWRSSILACKSVLLSGGLRDQRRAGSCMCAV